MNETLLLVNESQDHLDALTELLENVGYEVIPCCSPREALEQLQEEPNVNGVLTDLYLEGIDGWRLCRLLRGHENDAISELPIIVYSALLEGEIVEEISSQVGATDFLALPLEPQALLSRVRRALSGGTKFSRQPVNIISDLDDSTEKVRQVLDPSLFSCRHLKLDEVNDSISTERLFVLGADVERSSLHQLIPLIRPPGSPGVAILIHDGFSPSEILDCVLKGVDDVVAINELNNLEEIFWRCRRHRSLLRVRELASQQFRQNSSQKSSAKRMFELFLNPMN